MKHFLRRLTRPLLALALIATPTAAIAAPTAQEGALDEATLAAIQQTAMVAYSTFGGGSVTTVVATPDTPEATLTPGEEPKDDTGSLDLGEMVTYTSDEFEIAFPANWEVSQSGTNFNVRDPETRFSLQIENFGEDVPGLLMVPIFEGQSDLFARELGEGASIRSTERLTIGADELPALRMEFTGVPDSAVGTIDGVIYVIGAGLNGYALYAGAGVEAWETLGPVVDDIVRHLIIHPEYISLERAGDEPLTITSTDGAYSIDLPAGWMGSITDDDDLGLLFADPDLAVVGAVGASPVVDENDEMLVRLIESISGDLDDATVAELAQDVIDGMNLGGDEEVEIDESLSAVIAANSEEGIGIIRVAGSAPIMADAGMPFTLYISIYPTRAGAFVLFGEAEDVLTLEAEILEVINSLQFE